MPVPHPAMESESEWMHRCVPVRMQEGNEQDQAVAVCLSMWRDATRGRGDVPESKTFGAKLEIKQGGDREFEGYGAVFGNVDYGGDVIVPGAFKDTLADRRKLPQMFYMHDPSRIPGKWTAMSEDANGLHVKGRFSDTPIGNELYTLAKDGALSELSIGYRVPEGGMDHARDGTRRLKKIELWEVSLVSMAMNPMAEITFVKSRLTSSGVYRPTAREFDEWLRDPSGHHWRMTRNAAKKLVDLIYGGASGMPEPRDTGPGLRDAGGGGEARDAAESVVDRIRGAVGEIILRK